MLRAAENPSKEFYDKAIRDAGRSGLIQYQAFCYESAAYHFQQEKKYDERDFEFYLTQACYLYDDWYVRTGRLGMNCVFSTYESAHIKIFGEIFLYTSQGCAR